MAVLAGAMVAGSSLALDASRDEEAVRNRTAVGMLAMGLGATTAIIAGVVWMATEPTRPTVALGLGPASAQLTIRY